MQSKLKNRRNRKRTLLRSILHNSHEGISGIFKTHTHKDGTEPSRSFGGPGHSTADLRNAVAQRKLQWVCGQHCYTKATNTSSTQRVDLQRIAVCITPDSRAKQNQPRPSIQHLIQIQKSNKTALQVQRCKTRPPRTTLWRRKPLSKARKEKIVYLILSLAVDTRFK